MSLNVATILRETVAQHPDKPCLLVDGISVTYADVDRGSARAAAGLLNLGLVRGDMVAVQLENSADFVFSYFGLLRAGLTMVPLNPLLREPEVRHVMNDSGAKALLTSSSRVGEVARAAGDVPVFVRGSGELPSGVTPSPASVRRPAFDDVVPTSSEDTAVLLYTSGTTGAAQGRRAHPPPAPDERQHLGRALRVRSRRRLVGGRTVLPRLRAQPDRCPVRYGSTMTVLPRFEIATALEVMERDRVSIMFGVPTMYHALLAGGRDGPRPLRPSDWRSPAARRSPARPCARSRSASACCCSRATGCRSRAHRNLQPQQAGPARSSRSGSPSGGRGPRRRRGRPSPAPRGLTTSASWSSAGTTS